MRSLYQMRTLYSIENQQKTNIAHSKGRYTSDILLIGGFLFSDTRQFGKPLVWMRMEVSKMVLPVYNDDRDFYSVTLAFRQ